MLTVKRFHLAFGFLVISLVFAEIPHTAADIVKLKNGGEVRGTLVGSNSRRIDKKTNPVRIETIRGTVVEIERKDIEFVSHRRLAVEIYEIRAAKTLKTVEDQWKLANWCRQNKMASQSEKHLRKMQELLVGDKRSDLGPHLERISKAVGHFSEGRQGLGRKKLLRELARDMRRVDRSFRYSKVKGSINPTSAFKESTYQQ